MPSSFYYEFWRECRGTGNKLLSVRGFIILRPGDGLSSFSKDNSANFVVKKMRYEAFRGVYKFENTRKNFKLILVLMIVFVLESKGRNDV